MDFNCCVIFAIGSSIVSSRFRHLPTRFFFRDRFRSHVATIADLSACYTVGTHFAHVELVDFGLDIRVYTFSGDVFSALALTGSPCYAY